MLKALTLASSITLLALSLGAVAHTHHAHKVVAPAAPTPVIADDTLQNHWVFGVDGGIANNDWQSIGGISTIIQMLNIPYKTEDESYVGNEGVFLGYAFQITRHLSLGPTFGYHHINNNFYHITTISNAFINFDENSDIYDLLMTSTYQFDNKFNIFAQAGAAFDRAELEIASNASTASSRNVSTRPEVGFGIGRQLSNRVDIFCKYNYVIGNAVAPINALSPTFSIMNAGVSIKFA
jgi:opacity protein-like surface antigen